MGGQERRHLGEGEHEDQVEEQLKRRPPPLAVVRGLLESVVGDGRRG
jgi:hypothetical protein